MISQRQQTNLVNLIKRLKHDECIWFSDLHKSESEWLINAVKIQSRKYFEIEISSNYTKFIKKIWF